MPLSLKKERRVGDRTGLDWTGLLCKVKLDNQMRMTILRKGRAQRSALPYNRHSHLVGARRCGRCQAHSMNSKAYQTDTVLTVLYRTGLRCTALERGIWGGEEGAFGRSNRKLPRPLGPSQSLAFLDDMTQGSSWALKSTRSQIGAEKS